MSDHPRSLAGSPRQPLQQELLESEQLFRCVFDTAQDGILVLDAHTLTPLLANPALGRMLGHALPDLLALTLEQLHPGEHACGAGNLCLHGARRTAQGAPAPAAP